MEKMVSVKVINKEPIRINADGFEMFEDSILIVKDGVIKAYYNRELIESIMVMDDAQLVDRIDVDNLFEEITSDIKLFEKLQAKGNTNNQYEETLRCEGIVQALKGMEYRLKGIRK